MQPARRRRRARQRQLERWGLDEMRLRTIIRVGCVTVVALGLVLAGRFSTLLGVGGHPAAGGDHLSSATVSSRTDPTTHAEGAPSGAPPSGSSDAKLTATVRSNGDSGGCSSSGSHRLLQSYALRHQSRSTWDRRRWRPVGRRTTTGRSALASPTQPLRPSLRRAA
jgi:hypothetical protein